MKAEGDSVKKHAARLNRKAMECEFVLPRGKSDYSKKMVQFQLENGLGYSDIQEQILAEFTARPRMTLEETINFVEAKQMAKKDVAQLVINGGTEVNKVTISQKAKNGKKPDEKVHKEKCRAWDKECLWCKKRGHFARRIAKKNGDPRRTVDFQGLN